MGFSRQEYWSGFPCPPPGDLSDPGIEPVASALQADSLLGRHWGIPYSCHLFLIFSTSVRSFLSLIVFTLAWNDPLVSPVFLKRSTVLGFPGSSDGKESACNTGDLGSILGLGGSPGEDPTPGFLPGEFHGQRSLVGYSPWSCRVGHNWAVLFFFFCHMRS